MTVMDSPLGSMASLSTGSCLGLNTRHEFPYTKQVVSLIRQLLVIPEIIVSLWHNRILLSG